MDDPATGDDADRASRSGRGANGERRTTGDETAAVREAFDLLAHEMRLETLLASLDGWRGAETEARSYSELMRSVGTRDSGKFNYHLDRLRGHYLHRVEDGYVPAATTTALYRAVLATRPTTPTATTTLSPDADCPRCGAGLRARHERGFLSVSCPGCGDPGVAFTYPCPANRLDGRTDEEVLTATLRRARTAVDLARTGQCPDCSGQTTVAVDASDPDPVRIDCTDCTWTVAAGFLLALSGDPPVTAALVRAGVLVAEGRFWEWPTPTVEERDGSLELSVEGPAATATVVVDDAARVLSVTVDGDPVGD